VIAEEPEMALSIPMEMLMEEESTDREETEAEVVPETMARAEAGVPGASALLEFLLDAGIFAALCLPPAAVALAIFLRRRRAKKARNQAGQ